MNTMPSLSKLPSPEHCGDWHDKPLRWQVATSANIQKFSTKADASRFKSLWRKHGFLGAMNAF